MDTQMLMDKLIKAVSYQFKSDKTSPGVTISSLKHGNYYVSVVRYEGSFAKGKIVVCKAKGDTLEQALRGAAKKFLDQIDTQLNPIEELNSLVSDTSSAKKVFTDPGDFDLFPE